MNETYLLFSGTYSDVVRLAACVTCTAGSYCIPNNNPTICPQGWYCPAGTGYVWQACPPGTYGGSTGLVKLSDCTDCDGGKYCDVHNATTFTGSCSAGYYCTSGSDSKTPDGTGNGTAGPCPTGRYCPVSTANPQPCPAGTFNNRTMLTAQSECQSCLPGYYCDVPGLSWPTGLCQPGFYCASGSVSSNPPVVTSTGGPCAPG